MGHVALFVALAVVPVLALNSLATADTGTDRGTDPPARPTHRRAAPVPRRPGRHPPDAAAARASAPALTQEQRKELRASRRRRAGCARPARRRSAGLTDEQRQCLADQGVTRSRRLGRRHPAAGERRGSATPSRQAALRVWTARRAAIATAAGTIRSDDRIGVGPVQSEPGCGSPTSNHQRDSASISVTAARSSSLSAPGWRADEDHGERAVVPELVDGAGVEPLPDLGSGAAQVGHDRPGVGERVGALDPQHRRRARRGAARWSIASCLRDPPGGRVARRLRLRRAACRRWSRCTP